MMTRQRFWLAAFVSAGVPLVFSTSGQAQECQNQVLIDACLLGCSATEDVCGAVCRAVTTTCQAAARGHWWCKTAGRAGFNHRAQTRRPTAIMAI